MKFVATPTPVPLAYRVQDIAQKGNSQFDHWVESAIASFEAKLPVPPSCGAFNADGFFRIKRHQRSVCFAGGGGQAIGNVLCIKGMEPFAPDFAAALDTLAASRRADSGLSLLEHFILNEDKLPGCLLFDEAYAEGSIAATVHLGLANDGGSLPRLPLPVLCVRLPQTTMESAVREIAARASRSLWPKMETLAATGLGAYVYWYPTLPLRAVEFKPSSSASTIAMAEGWMSLAGRLLRSGFLPTTAHSFGRGQCCNRQNSVIDGGFVDLSSVVRVADVERLEDLFIGVQMTIWEIAATILHVLGHPLKRDGSSIARFDYPAQVVLHMVRERLAQECGQNVDPRLRQFFAATETADSAARMLDQVQRIATSQLNRLGPNEQPSV